MSVPSTIQVSLAEVHVLKSRGVNWTPWAGVLAKLEVWMANCDPGMRECRRAPYVSGAVMGFAYTRAIGDPEWAAALVSTWDLGGAEATYRLVSGRRA